MSISRWCIAFVFFALGGFVAANIGPGWNDLMNHFETTTIINCRHNPLDECTEIYWGPPRRSEEAECVDGNTGRSWVRREELDGRTDCNAKTSGGI